MSNLRDIPILNWSVFFNNNSPCVRLLILANGVANLYRCCCISNPLVYLSSQCSCRSSRRYRTITIWQFGVTIHCFDESTREKKAEPQLWKPSSSSFNNSSFSSIFEREIHPSNDTVALLKKWGAWVNVAHSGGED